MASEGEDGMNDHLFGFTSSDGSWKDVFPSFGLRFIQVYRNGPSLFHFNTFPWPVFPSILNPVYGNSVFSIANPQLPQKEQELVPKDWQECDIYLKQQ